MTAKVFEVAAEGDTLLIYALQTDPGPLQIGQTATLTLVASNPARHPVTLRSIVLTIPVGTEARELTADPSDLQIGQPAGWDAGQQGGTITFNAPEGAEVGGDGLSFTIARLVVNAEPGTASIAIDETGAAAGGAPMVRSWAIDVPKFPAQFMLGDLTATAFEVAECGTTVLMWSGSAPPDQAVSYMLDYQPTPDGSTVNIPVGHRGPYVSVALTRTDEVTFTLTALVAAPGQDGPESFVRQVTVTMVPLTAKVEPPRVGVNGLVRLTWDAPSADHCTLDDGTSLAAKGTVYRIIPASRSVTITAPGRDGKSRQRQLDIAVDPSIKATEGGHVVAGSRGGDGSNGQVCSFFDKPCDPTAESGGRGGDASFSGSLPMLDPSGQPQRVIPISVVGGSGGTGGRGGSRELDDGQFASPGGNGGDGGDAILDITLDSPDPTPAHYLITLSGGSGGGGGWSGNDWIQPPELSPSGNSGSASITIDGQPVPGG